MSHNSIGLPTARGSGTNGYVQRNIASVKESRSQTGVSGHFARRKHQQEKKARDLHIPRIRDKRIAQHDEKRNVSVKCMELRETLEEDGLSDTEIDSRVSALREKLLSQKKPKDVQVEYQELNNKDISRDLKEEENRRFGRAIRRRSESPDREARNFIKGFKLDPTMY